jgi:hypothetical protein
MIMELFYNDELFREHTNLEIFEHLCNYPDLFLNTYYQDRVLELLELYFNAKFM